MNGKIVQLMTLASVLAFAPAIFAEPHEITASLTLDQVIETVMRDNPQLRSLRARWEATQQRPAQETALPNPMLAVTTGNSPDEFKFPSTQDTRVGIEQQFPWAGKLGLRGKVATKDAEAMQREYETMQRDLIQLVKESYFNLFAVQRSLSVTRSEEDVLNRMESIAQARYRVNEVAQQDVLKAQSEITMLKQRCLELEQQEVVLKARLNQVLNRRADSPLGLAVTEPRQEFDFQAGDLFRLAEQSRPEIKKAQAEIQRSEAQRNLMKKEFFPDYRLGVEYGRMNSGFMDFSGSDNVVMLMVGIDLPIWRTKYRAGVREAEKRIESSRADLEAAEQQASLDVQDAYFKLLTARRSLELYKTALLPQAEMRFKASEAGYRTGKVSFLDLLESERFLLSVRVMAAMAEGNVGMELGRLERAVGTDLATIAVPKGEPR